MSKNKPIFVTSPLLPPLEEFQTYLKEIWESKWLTNNGQFHQQLEKELCDYLGVKHVCLFSNGTLALITALQALGITGEVITTPFSFVATTHSLWWNNIKPVFVDIDPYTFNLDPTKVEAAITPKTTAIMPVHVYGTPCNLKAFEQIAETYNLKLIYDAAHAFGVEINGNSILNFGDLSILSFHATKVFNTFEGGAIICQDEKMKRHIDDLKNFGFRGETTVVAAGINAKMNEMQAAFGILQLKYIEEAREKRKKIAKTYRQTLKSTEGITCLNDFPDIKHAYSYFPVLIEQEKYGMSRDQLYEKLKENNIYSRRYFYPLISNFPTYKGLSSAKKDNLPNANNIAKHVLCLPIYPSLEIEDVYRISDIILESKFK
ncbi:DegT/DnrJ/EryC1/StrS family aminotransferase [Marinilabilia salmonicolor]|uniref:DegT/DnrJ/EryC1/StrS family aminotransferase n=1 Tax=Marinilabilia salmonicolor TaxID=989 RepID=UPI00029AD34A|nr:DegT/DnrJ/EryC1/StrS family aminotransferase [Marinilabilia salmonicolor]